MTQQANCTRSKNTRNSSFGYGKANLLGNLRCVRILNDNFFLIRASILECFNGMKNLRGALMIFAPFGITLEAEAHSATV
jgi:hypothetical protein